MKLTSFTLAATLLMTTFASAQSAVESVRSQLADQGYTVTGVTRNGNQVTVSSQGNGKHRDVSFNAATGKVTSDDYGRSSGDDRHADNDDNDRNHSENDDDRDHGRGHSEGHDRDSDHGSSGSDHGGSDNDSGHDSDSDGHDND
ncbi:MAG: hypothetical protein WBC85_06930 [Planktotalea sp.]|uniref:hypothetical protein n=1 Tax=Planktotalea sp. TaxID=2029877 RepID=UPI003C768730